MKKHWLTFLAVLPLAMPGIVLADMSGTSGAGANPAPSTPGTPAENGAPATGGTPTPGSSYGTSGNANSPTTGSSTSGTGQGTTHKHHHRKTTPPSTTATDNTSGSGSINGAGTAGFDEWCEEHPARSVGVDPPVLSAVRVTDLNGLFQHRRNTGGGGKNPAAFCFNINRMKRLKTALLIPGLFVAIVLLLPRKSWADDETLIDSSGHSNPTDSPNAPVHPFTPLKENPKPKTAAPAKGAAHKSSAKNKNKQSAAKKKTYVQKTRPRKKKTSRVHPLSVNQLCFYRAIGPVFASQSRRPAFLAERPLPLFPDVEICFGSCPSPWNALTTGIRLYPQPFEKRQPYHRDRPDSWPRCPVPISNFKPCLFLKPI